MPQSTETTNSPVTPSSARLRVAIAGASGFVGTALIDALAADCDIVALSRNPGRLSATARTANATHGGLTWRQCDLFSARQTEDALAGCDVAVFLVHSMLPSARLTQGSFDDLDLIIADNFGRAARACGVRRVVYLGGIIPPEDLSRHLASRLEVEEAIAAHNVPLVALRAGLVIGRGGSSFDMMRKLVQRLPAMLCPKWTMTRSCPVSIDDVVRVMAKVVADPAIPSGSYDLGGSEVVTYLDMMKVTAGMMGKRRLMVPVFLFSPKLSRLWVRLVTGAPKELVAPLVESLRHEMIPRDHLIFDRYGIKPVSFRQALRAALDAESASASVRRSAPGRAVNVNTVCSVQRLPLPKGKSANWIADRYTHWLIQFLWPFIKIGRTADGSLLFQFSPGIPSLKFTLLHLQYIANRSDEKRQLYFITGGVLTSQRKNNPGRFEFRSVLDGRYAMAAIFDYPPALPWWLYKNTQAIAHLIVMRAFRRHLVGVVRRQVSA